jgi:hypothetical protein
MLYWILLLLPVGSQSSNRSLSLARNITQRSLGLRSGLEVEESEANDTVDDIERQRPTIDHPARNIDAETKFLRNFAREGGRRVLPHAPPRPIIDKMHRWYCGLCTVGVGHWQVRTHKQLKRGRL